MLYLNRDHWTLDHMNALGDRALAWIIVKCCSSHHSDRIGTGCFVMLLYPMTCVNLDVGVFLFVCICQLPAEIFLSVLYLGELKQH